MEGGEGDGPEHHALNHTAALTAMSKERGGRRGSGLSTCVQDILGWRAQFESAGRGKNSQLCADLGKLCCSISCMLTRGLLLIPTPSRVSLYVILCKPFPPTPESAEDNDERRCESALQVRQAFMNTATRPVKREGSKSQAAPASNL